VVQGRGGAGVLPVQGQPRDRGAGEARQVGPRGGVRDPGVPGGGRLREGLQGQAPRVRRDLRDEGVGTARR
jgi:hypothetical protein